MGHLTHSGWAGEGSAGHQPYYLWIQNSVFLAVRDYLVEYGDTVKGEKEETVS